MHAALLLGYGASAINPYMAFASLAELVNKGELQLNYETAEKNYIKAICKGLLRIMSKMGIVPFVPTGEPNFLNRTN